MTNGKRLYKDMKALGEIKIWTWTMAQRGSNIEECEGIKILRQEKHTSRGSKLMNLFDCILYVHIHVLDCIA
jgi:hypothetical protein